MPSAVRLSAVAASAVSLSLVAAGAAGAKGDYPAKVEKRFVRQCVKAAKEEEPGIDTAKVRKVCNYTLTCIGGKLTLKEFRAAESNDPAIKSCIRKTKRHFS